VCLLAVAQALPVRRSDAAELRRLRLLRTF
jgi:hypothetical protein